VRKKQRGAGFTQKKDKRGIAVSDGVKVRKVGTTLLKPLSVLGGKNWKTSQEGARPEEWELGRIGGKRHSLGSCAGGIKGKKSDQKTKGKKKGCCAGKIPASIRAIGLPGTGHQPASLGKKGEKREREDEKESRRVLIGRPQKMGWEFKWPFFGTGAQKWQRKKKGGKQDRTDYHGTWLNSSRSKSKQSKEKKSRQGLVKKTGG